MTPSTSSDSTVTPSAASCDLGTLSRLELSRDHERMMAAVRSRCAGPRPWQLRKQSDAADLARLAQWCGRLQILALDLSVDLRARLQLEVTVPCLPDPRGPLVVAPVAQLGLICREEGMRLPQPGYSFVQILAPGHVFHPNVSAADQILCLGPRLPAGIPATEIVMLAYMALTMIAVQFDPGNAAGILNATAGDWFQRNADRLPLSREPFLRPRTSAS